MVTGKLVMSYLVRVELVRVELVRVELVRVELVRKELRHDRPGLHPGDGGVLRGVRGLHLRRREAVTMESLIAGGIAVLLIVYLLAALIRPERF